jgi:Fe-S-cluster-containing dehydrogenase component
MKINRKKFILGLGIAIGGIVAKPIFDGMPRLTLAKPVDIVMPVRLAMVIDLKACNANNNCRDCIDACHGVHNVPAIGNPKDEIKWIWAVPYEYSFPGDDHEFMKKELKSRPSLVLCNHCDNPPCVNVCPTRATFKREDGVVMMDYHRCIGCRYCMAACPYGSRSFNWRDPRSFIGIVNPGFPTRTRGVVEKCNYCEERLADGLLPACVEACKNNALVFGDINNPNSKARQLVDSKYSIKRKAGLGTKPQVYYLV